MILEKSKLANHANEISYHKKVDKAVDSVRDAARVAVL